MYVYLPLVEMRQDPTPKARVVSQALFAERVREIARAGDWIKIATPDGYEGWVVLSALIDRQESYEGALEVTRLSAHVYAEPDTEYGPILTLPYGAKLQLIDSSSKRWHQIVLVDGRKAYIQKGDALQEPFELVAFCKQFIGLPYTWGGRSSFGFDCSGFVQMVYARLGIQLPRDAREQILVAKKESVIPALGDLIFWGKGEEDIRHVAMSLGGIEFIHTSSRENKPYLRISQLTDFEWSGALEAHYPFRTIRTLFR
jgi:hypothetical protein